MVSAFKRRTRAVSVIEHDHAERHTETATNRIFGIRAECVTHAEMKHIKVNNFTAKQKLRLRIGTAVRIYRQMNHPTVQNRDEPGHAGLERKRSRFFLVFILACKTEVREIRTKGKILIHAERATRIEREQETRLVIDGLRRKTHRGRPVENLRPATKTGQKRPGVRTVRRSL